MLECLCVRIVDSVVVRKWCRSVGLGLGNRGIKALAIWATPPTPRPTQPECRPDLSQCVVCVVLCVWVRESCHKKENCLCLFFAS